MNWKKCAVLLITVFTSAIAEITSGPKDTVVKVGGFAVLHCTVFPRNACVLWIHLYPKENDYDNGVEAEVYECDGGVRNTFKKRFYVARNNSTGKADLHITNATWNNNGAYECQDQEGYGDRQSANIFIIDDDPRCESSVPLLEVIGQNDCGIQPDEIRLTCAIRYKGPKSNQMMLEWRAVGDNQKLDQTCEVIEDQLICTVQLNTTLDLNGTSYFCTTTPSATAQYSCTTKSINLLLLSKTVTEDGSFQCKANCTRENDICNKSLKVSPTPPNQSAPNNASSGATELWPGFLFVLLLASNLIH